MKDSLINTENHEGTTNQCHEIWVQSKNDNFKQNAIQQLNNDNEY